MTKLFLSAAFMIAFLGGGCTATTDVVGSGPAELDVGDGVVAADSAGPGPADTVWPLAVESASGRIEVYQPQPESFVGNQLTARAAVSLTTPQATDPTFGAVWFSARVSTDRDDRTVTIEDVDIKDVRIPDVPKAQENDLAQVIKRELVRLDVAFSLDELMTGLEFTKREQAEAQQIRVDPPRIVFSTVPAALISVDGQPKLQASDQPQVMRVINTPFVLLLDTGAKRYYLKTGATWMTASDLGGQWSATAEVPAAITAAAMKLVSPPATSNPVETPVAGPPEKIIVATDPTELIVTDGAPTYSPLVGNDLLYVSNTQADILFDVATRTNYLLISGRWYRSGSLNGPWQYAAANQVPATFAKIPADSPKADVLTFVAGTTEAREAILDASIPQTAAIRRDAGAGLSVTYDGEPRFDPIRDTAMSYAVNSADAVIRISGFYYCCHEAVWYESASPTGPWAVCLSVPSAIYAIPPTYPIYNCTYVHVYGSTPDVVYCGYLPGYAGCYVYGSTVVYGTGYYYPGWYGSVYYPRPWTWGFGACYDGWDGAWSFGFGYGWGPVWFARDHWDHHGWWGPGGFRDWHHFHDPHFAHGHDGHDGRFDGFGGHPNLYRRDGNLGRNVSVRAGERGHSFGGAAGRPNNVYAGHDGQVFRRGNDGWEGRQQRGWTRMNSVPESRANEARPPERGGFQSPTSGGLEAEHAARERGAVRAGGFRGGGGSFQGGGSRGGGFHGGGSRGGGGGGGGGRR